MMGDEIAGGIIGDHASKFYHLPNSPNYNKAPQKNRIPTMVWVALYAISALTMASIGCHAGLTCARRPPVVPAFVLVFSVIMVLIADLDAPRSGISALSQRPLLDLRNTMNAPND